MTSKIINCYLEEQRKEALNAFIGIIETASKIREKVWCEWLETRRKKTM